MNLYFNIPLILQSDKMKITDKGENDIKATKIPVIQLNC